MTLEQAIELGRRMMACEGFEWRAGMCGIDVPVRACVAGPLLIIDAGRIERGILGVVRRGVFEHVPAVGVVPDPRDPGTVGHALAMMREALGQPSAHIQPLSSRYGPYCSPERYALVIGLEVRGLDGPTEAGALVEGWEQAAGLRDMFARDTARSTAGRDS